jgi:queuine tRNA-ribosyltransferase
MPVGTVGTVKTLTPEELWAAGVELVLGNTYHLLHQPGVTTLEQMGGLARFMGWDGPTLTDSGGFQVFSLSATRKIDDEGVTFQSIYDGRTIRLTPRSVCETEWKIGADIFHALDECPPFPATHKEVEKATTLSVKWAAEFLQAFKSLDELHPGTGKSPFLVVQGGLYEDLRLECIERLSVLSPPGFGIGGVSVGEPAQEMLRVADICCKALPVGKPRHLLGVGTPSDLIGAIGAGVDLFDCVLPTRNGRNGQAFTSRGVINLRLQRWKTVDLPLDDRCPCPACSKFSMAYLHHLTLAGEMLGMRLISMHNITFYQDLVRRAREAIRLDKYTAFSREIMNELESDAMQSE